ncbi:hypothetical protein [Litoreibacter halocynthiae]|jgi:hypothetical protein|uniref:hypothetical protein n=1 Tax=Litoreibacter halocynthiae TaxID=1242689 RepID=UPI002490736A|nr:hypothetical protein [Litoreibacter halocynthiae]
MIDAIAIVLMCNAIAAFFTAFYFQAAVIFRLLRDSNPGIGIGDSNSFQANFSRFLAGEIYSDLKPKWSKAVLWVVVSFMAIFALAGIAELTK